MELNTRKITIDDFRDYFGIDLSKALNDSDNPSMGAVGFIERETDRLEAFIDARLNRDMEVYYRHMTDSQKAHYKKALLEQCYYVYKNGEIGADSGYDMDKGEVASNGTLSAKTIAPNAKNHLISAGVWNANVYGSLWYGY